MKGFASSPALVAGLLGATTTVACVLLACSERAKFEESAPVLVADAEAEAGAPVDDASAPPTCGIHCSRDLKQVLDGCRDAETVVTTCSADQGCGDGKCVDACTAAVLNKGSAGCDFWTVPPDVKAERGRCFAALVSNTWDRGVTLTAEVGDEPLDISGSTYVVAVENDEPVYTLLQGPLLSGQAAVVFLSSESAPCPPNVKPALLLDPTHHGTGRGKAFHLRSDAPISAYSIYPYGGADSFIPSATLLLPTSSWSTNYVAVSPYNFGDTKRQRSLQIIANEDDTTVSLKPIVDIVAASGVPGGPAGTTQSWTLGKGEVIQFLQTSMAGSPIESSKPVAVFGGSECTELPTPYCDALQQQIPSFSQWGTEYAVVPFKPRIASFSSDVREQVPYTLVGAVDGTALTYEPSRPRNAPETLRSGEVASFMTEDLFVVKSQDEMHPFHANVYMTGATFPGGTANQVLGDPEFVNVPPADQYLDRYVFFTDFTFPDTTMTVVRRKTASGFVPVELECAGEITNFEPLGSSGEFEYAWVQLTSGFVGQSFAKGTCGYGRQEAHSAGPFSVTVWGLAPYASYGYVAGTGLRPIHRAPPPSVH